MIYVRYRRGGVLHRYEDPQSTYCGRSLDGARHVKQNRRIGRCRECERVAAIRTDLKERRPGINRMALLRELVDTRARVRERQ